eukprot:82785_1
MTDYYDEDNGDYYDDTATGTGIEECSVNFMDSSIDYFPSTSTMHRASNLDFGVICQPLTQSQDGVETPLVQFNEGSAIRCRACRAYINPFIEWVSNGIHNHWICNLCGVSNEITNSYYKEKDQGLRKELQFGSIEIVAPDEYCVRPPQFPSYLFVINVNKQLIESNVLLGICDTIKQILNDDDQSSTFNNEQTQIGFITYSHRIHYYSLKPNLTKPKMIVINDINDALLPIPSNRIMTNLSESRELIDHLLTILPSLHESTPQTSNENALGTAIECAFSALREIGGKIICFSFGLPSLGKGKVMNRTKSYESQSDASEYDKLLKRSNNFFMDLAISLTKYQISCDLFQMTSAEESYCDISTIKGICRCSGGELFYYDQYNAVRHEDSFCADLYKLLTRRKGWESVMRIRVSKGISIKNYYGCFYRRSADLLSIPTIDSDKAVTIVLCHSQQQDNGTTEDDTSNNKNSLLNTPYVYVQSALLYTNNNGQRRIRCCTKRIPVTSSYEELFNNINLSVMTAVVAKQAVFKMLSKDIASSRMFIQDSCISALQSYCKYCGINNGLKTENDYPLALRYWPLNTLGLLKCCAFADIRDVAKWINFDERVSTLIHILHLSSNHIELLVRPSLYRIDDIIDLDADTLNDEYYLPSESPLTLKAMAPNGLYVLDNGQNFIIRMGKNVSTEITQWFLQRTRDSQWQLQQRESNKYMDKLYSILEYLQSINYKNQSIQIISETQSDKNKAFCTIYLIRDRTESVMSYDEFFNFIYKQTKPNNKIR